MTLETYTGSIEFDADGVFLKTNKKDPGKRIPFNQIQTVTLIPPKFGVNAGCIYIQIAGAPVINQFATATSYVSNPYAIMFRKNQAEEAESFKAALEKAISDCISGSNAKSKSSDMDLLAALKLLYSAGILSDEEFLQKKAIILDL